MTAWMNEPLTNGVFILGLCVVGIVAGLIMALVDRK